MEELVIFHSLKCEGHDGPPEIVDDKGGYATAGPKVLETGVGRWVMYVSMVQ